MRKPKIYASGFLLLLLVVATCNAQEQGSFAPLSKEFVEYQNGEKKGVIPAPFQPDFSVFETSHQKKMDFPASFDLRQEDGVTAVRNQGTIGTCWTFAALGSFESRLKVRDGELHDFSEANMATCHGFLNGPDDGGNYYLAAAYATQGIVTENSDPYSSLTAFRGCVEVEKDRYITEIRWLPEKADMIKNTLYNYGAVATSMHAGEQQQYYNSTDYTWYYGGNDATDHGVLIVGWDDEKEVTGGYDSPESPNGAWIIKNSWGPDFGEAGYFYMSYNDTKGATNNAIYLDDLPASQVDTLYSVDKLGMISAYGYQGHPEAFGMVKYVAQGEESISRVGTYISSGGTTVSVEIYDDFDPATKKLSNRRGELSDQYCLYPGYYTFNVEANVTDDFYVKVKYTTQGHGYPVPVEYSISGYATAEISSAGTCYISKDGVSWEDIFNPEADIEADICIRAYALNDQAIQASFTTSKTLVCQNGTVDFNDISTGVIDTYAWDFGEGASPATASTAGPHTVTYTTPGTKTITLTVEGAEGTNTVIRKDYIEVVDEVPVYFDSELVEAFHKETFNLMPIGDAETFVFDGPGTITVDGNQASIILNDESIKEATYYVTATIGGCEGSDSIKVLFNERPANDDVCDAIELTLGENGPFSNQYATVQENEPMPDTTGAGCSAPMKWCNEGGLQNSVWFKYTAPESGNVSFASEGIDAQIALYDAESCSDLLSENYTLLAANDDYAADESNAIINHVDGLTPGKTYWLQLDGSAGGEMGEFSLTISEERYNVGFDKVNNEEFSFVVSPNPADNYLSISAGSVNEAVQVQLITADGRLLLAKQHDFANVHRLKLNIENYTEGIYFLRIIGDKIQETHKLLIQ
jgi:C1A family cysteine protease/PKD repeat protein